MGLNVLKNNKVVQLLLVLLILLAVFLITNKVINTFSKNTSEHNLKVAVEATKDLKRVNDINKKNLEDVKKHEERLKEDAIITKELKDDKEEQVKKIEEITEKAKKSINVVKTIIDKKKKEKTIKKVKETKKQLVKEPVPKKVVIKTDNKELEEKLDTILIESIWEAYNLIENEEKD